ncbi:hypothetical protein Pmar_PMAR004384 [Perkinsus marinus ATCC 50983]|uniref:C-CAP/cofactor C-like domain-containing protein n=1 Tax=Perkinsus marinus (strain ATCC 50983 / TXsc) TaxID=423536 RepID=C5KAI3_PERM5|nr:hypothetical protein Pmar_PMAR004384 [Perkinsus marinus ATCC 50983]EER18519.1 hypothetical protein Pmar_PMAR004384 [Perkinsus marinus ATCC 50983]|eukprot:XP_002786723.1 hypothetical protein Pmar_PMAR004384 [Perkinsus marinus ATCC 50983]
MPSVAQASRPDPRDFIFSGKTGEKLIRKRGEIRGYDFSIDRCEACVIYLVDHISQVFIDECKDCKSTGDFGE